MVLSGDILMIYFEYCYTMMNINNNNKLMNKFKNTVSICVDECLADDEEMKLKVYEIILILKNIHFVEIYGIANIITMTHYMIN